VVVVFALGSFTDPLENVGGGSKRLSLLLVGKWCWVN
jgi:hypothetical protein